MAYRETYRIARPPAMVARRLADEYGEAAIAGVAPGADAPEETATTRWRRRRWLYRETVSLDRRAGTVERRVALPGAVRAATLLALPVALGAVALGARPLVQLGVLWASAGLVVLTVGHRCPGVVPAPELSGPTVSRRLDPVVLPGLAAVLVALAGAFGTAPPGGATAVLVAVLVAVGGASALVGVRAREDGLSTLVLPLSGLLPAVLGVANATVADRAFAHLPPAVATALALVVAAASVALFHGYCLVTLRELRHSDLAGLSGGPRLVGGALYAAASVALVATLAAVTGAPPVGPVGDSLAGGAVPHLPAAGVALAVAAPLVVMVVAWAGYLARGALTRLQVAVASERSPPPAGVDSDVPVLRVESSTPFVRPTRLPRGVVVSSAVERALSERELAAVVAHEVSHLAGRDLDRELAATAAAVAPGGRNAVLALSDVAGAELAADDRAAAAVGVDPLVGALRTLERQHGGAGGSRRVEGLRGLATAPYRLFFGRTLREAATPTVEERVARLVGG